MQLSACTHVFYWDEDQIDYICDKCKCNLNVFINRINDDNYSDRQAKQLENNLWTKQN